MRSRFFPFLLTLLSALAPLAVRADTITLKADTWMPYNGDGKAETGYMLDVARTVFEAKGHKVVYAVTPWEKAVAETRSGKCTGIIGASRDDTPDFVFPAEELGVSVQLFCVRSGNPWKYAGINSLKPIKLGVIKDYAYFDELDAYIKTAPPNVVFSDDEENPLPSNLTKLVEGDLGAVVEDRSVLKYTLAKMKLQGKVVFAMSTANATKSDKVYIAFSPKNPKSAEYARILSEGVAALRSSGALARILAKYGLTDWK